MKLRVLGSGSAGNCYILGNDKEALIIEAGVSFKEVKKALDFKISKIRCVIISHEHNDHRKYWYEYVTAGIPVFEPYRNDGNLIEFADSQFLIRAFDLVHSVPCFGFLIEHPDMGRLLFVTDTEYVKYRFRNINHLLVESNYDKEQLVDNGDDLVKRNHVLTGHMEIGTTCKFIQANKNPALRDVILLHLSSDNSDAVQFKNKAQNVAGNSVNVFVAEKGLEVNLNLCPF